MAYTLHMYLRVICWVSLLRLSPVAMCGRSSADSVINARLTRASEFLTPIAMQTEQDPLQTFLAQLTPAELQQLRHHLISDGKPAS